MDPEAIAGMTTATVTFAQIFKAFVSRKLALPLAGLLALASLGAWAYSHGGVPPEHVWDYYLAYGLVMTSAAGVFGLINQGSEQITNIKGAASNMVAAIKGTGDGKAGG
jgi:hypothetical protein